MGILHNVQTKKLSTIITKVFFIIICNMLVCSAQASENKILVTPAKLNFSNFHDKFTAIGQVKSEHSRTYNAKITGTINSIAISQGRNVSAGDVLITIDEDLANATKELAQATFDAAESSHKRDLSLLEKKIISSDISDKSKVALEGARFDLVNALNKYEDMIITAPYDGYIGVVRARVGDDVKIGDYLFSIVANGEKTVFVDLPETMHAKIDQDSLIYAYDSNNTKIQGKLIAVSDYLNDNGTITAKVTFPADSFLIHGSYIEVEMIFSQHEALAIPEKILLKNNNGNFVYKITDDNKIEQVYITTGSRTDNMIEVISGKLQKDDLLVLSGLTKVYDGAVIEIIDAASDQPN